MVNIKVINQVPGLFLGMGIGVKVEWKLLAETREKWEGCWKHWRPKLSSWKFTFLGQDITWTHLVPFLAPINHFCCDTQLMHGGSGSGRDDVMSWFHLEARLACLCDEVEEEPIIPLYNPDKLNQEHCQAPAGPDTESLIWCATEAPEPRYQQIHRWILQ